MAVISVQQRSRVSTLKAGISVSLGRGARAGSQGVRWCLVVLFPRAFVGTKQETHHTISIAICTYSASAPQLDSKRQQIHFLAVDHVSVVAPS